jgi:hypothetical protein
MKAFTVGFISLLWFLFQEFTFGQEDDSGRELRKKLRKSAAPKLVKASKAPRIEVRSQTAAPKTTKAPKKTKA